MRIAANHNLGQLSLKPNSAKRRKLRWKYIIFCALIIPAFSLSYNACDRKKEDMPAAPPITSPLSREYIGYGVITASFTHITADPVDDSPSIGYLRRGSLVRIVKRQTIKTQNIFVTWVLTDGSSDDTDAAGWLKEEVMDIYDNESQARTASESMFK